MTYQYRWTPGSWQFLKAQNLPWLQSACRERHLPVFQMNRQELIQALLQWDKEQE